MGIVKISTGILKGAQLQEKTPNELITFAASGQLELKQVSFFNQRLHRVIFRNVSFIESGFGRSLLESIVFRRCTFRRVDFTRTRFVNCYFSDCTFTDCDPYYASFARSVVTPASFKLCYRSDDDINRALLLFSSLRRALKNAGNSRLAGAADYYYRVWERRLLHTRWKSTETSGKGPWLWSWFLFVLNGYGERPGYLAFWILGLVTIMSFVYKRWFPLSVTENSGLLDDNGIHASLSASNEKSIQLWPTLLRTRNTRIHVLAFDLPRPTLAILSQFPRLHRNILAVVRRADSRIDCGSHLLCLRCV
jgi:uncharacterized protein YjbI with pentapeptide repeats